LAMMSSCGEPHGCRSADALVTERFIAATDAEPKPDRTARPGNL
jgi:hypothetical protein